MNTQRRASCISTAMLRPDEDTSVTSVIGYIQRKAERVTLKTQQLLGRTAGSKSQYMSVHPGESFNKKHVKMISVALFLLCVSVCAMYSVVYYTYYWKPCTKKFLYNRTGAAEKHRASTNSCATDIHANWDKYTWSKEETMTSCNKCFSPARVAPLLQSNNSKSNAANSSEMD